jgi:hypothetical protein
MRHDVVMGVACGEEGHRVFSEVPSSDFAETKHAFAEIQ